MSKQATQYSPVTAYTVTQPVIVNGTDINSGLYPVLNYMPPNATYPFIYVPIAEFSRVGAKVVWDETKQLLTVTTDYNTLKNQVGALTNETSYLSSVIDSLENGGMGNSVSNNTWEGGFVAQEGDWIYFRRITKYYPTTPGDLYKIKTDGTGDTKVSDDKAYFINVLNGWVYYMDMNDHLYKIKTDGTAKTLLANDFATSIMVIGNWVYYRNQSDGSKLYKINIDGSSRTKLNDDGTYSLNFAQDWIFYSNGTDGKIYKIRTDGTGRQKLNDVVVVGAFVILNDWVYYMVQGTSDNHSLYKMKIDGSNVTRLTTDDVARFNVSGGYIYYTKVVDNPGGTLYKMRLDGTSPMSFNIRNVIELNVIGDWVYYQTMVKTTFKVRTDGTGNVAMYPIGTNA